MKKLVFLLLFLIGGMTASAQKKVYHFPMSDYTPTPGNLAARQEFQADRFGLYIHWGIYSILGDGEWVMFQQKIPFDKYKHLADFFNPQAFNAKEWVSMAKSAGMKYITITARHHDGFSMFDTKASDYNIVDATPYGRDPMKELAAECKKQGIKLNFYYSLLDWIRDDYNYKNKIVDGVPVDTDWDSYIEFMKAQLTELLTNYGEIGCIWFDGYWQRPDVNWHFDEIYSLIHKLSPNTLIANNHHITIIPGEDIQTFERDLPGENVQGFSGGVEVSKLPLETCTTMGKAWGFNINDKNPKTPKQVIDLLVGAAGKNANLLMNVGPMPNGKIQSEFTESLAKVGEWTAKYGETIYGTQGSIIPNQEWGVLTSKGNKVYVHIIKPVKDAYLFIPNLKVKVKSAYGFDENVKLKFKQQKEGVFVYIKDLKENAIDQIITLTVKM